MANIRRYDHNEAIRLYKSGLEIRTIAERYGVTVSAIGCMLKSYGITLRYDKHRKARRYDHSEAIRLYKSGLEVRAVAEHFGVSAGAIGSVLKANGITLRGSKWFKENRVSTPAPVAAKVVSPAPVVERPVAAPIVAPPAPVVERPAVAATTSYKTPDVERIVKLVDLDVKAELVAEIVGISHALSATLVETIKAARRIA